MPAKKKDAGASAPTVQKEVPVSVTEQVLALEEAVIEEARAWPSGPNSDAPKAALRGVGKAISSFRNALETNERLERP